MRQPLPRLLLLLLACAGVYLVGNRSVPLWDRDEPRFAQTSRQMLQSGDWVVPRLYDTVRTAKPPLIYWAQASCMKILGDQGAAGVFAARLPSTVAMVLTLAVVAWALWRHAGPAHALWTVLILSSSVLVVMAAKAGLTDSVLLLFVTIAQLCLYAAWRGRGTWGLTVVMALAVALALLTKGPVAIGVQVMTLLALGVLRLTLRGADETPVVRGFNPVVRSAGDVENAGGVGAALAAGINVEGGGTAAKAAPTPTPISDVTTGAEPLDVGRFAPSPFGRPTFKVLVGLLIVLAVGLPWVHLVERRHPGFIRTAFNHEIKDRTATGLEGHKGWPGYYLVSIWPTFLPWSLILPLALVTAWKRRREPPVRFALAAVAGPWLMFEVVQTKLPHYLLPCFPPLAFLAADAVLHCLRRTPGDSEATASPLADPALLNAVVVWAIIAALLGLAPWAAAHWFRPLPWLATGLLSLAAVGYAVAVVLPFRSGRAGRALATMGVGMLALCLLLYGLYLPSAPFLRLSIDAARVLRDEGATGPGQAIMLDYKEPSLAFYQGGTIREETSLIATERLLKTCPPWLVMTNEVYAAPGTDKKDLEIIARFRGLDLSASMRVIEVLVVKKKGKNGAP